jgi:hypothetical protein
MYPREVPPFHFESRLLQGLATVLDSSSRAWLELMLTSLGSNTIVLVNDGMGKK